MAETAQRWSRAMPTEPGVYWYLTLRTRRLRIVEIREGGTMSIALNLHSFRGKKEIPAAWKNFSEAAFFCGPLRCPELE